MAVNGIHDDQVDAVATAIRSAGGTAAGFVVDVTDEDRVGELVASIGSTLGPVEVLVVNATGPQPDIALADTTWRDHLDQLGFFVKARCCWASPCSRGCASGAGAGSSTSTPRWPTDRRRTARRTPRPRPHRRAWPVPGPRARTGRHHGEHGGAGLRPRRATSGRRRR